MKLAYVGDGPRDHAMLPPLVERAVGPHEVSFSAWRQITVHGGGYEKKLRFARIRAERDGLHGVVAVVDRDRGESRLPALERGRAERQRPVGIGEADPHGEAWLVDDLEPLRTVLGLAATAKAPAGKDPKNELQALVDARGSETPLLELIRLIAGAVDPTRCRRPRETGLAAFMDDLRREFRAP